MDDTIIEHDSSQSLEPLGRAGASSDLHSELPNSPALTTNVGGRPRLGFRFKRQGKAISFFKWDADLKLDRYIGSLTFKELEEQLARKKQESRLVERP